MHYNIVPTVMRDTGPDYRTGWIRDGDWFRTYGDLSTGLGELGTVLRGIPLAGQRHILAAARDPEAKPILRRILRSPNVKEELVRQAERDMTEAMKPKPESPIVFKALTSKMVAGFRRAEAAIVDAMPWKETEDGKEALELAQVADDPKEALSLYYTEVALDAFSPTPPILSPFEEEEGLFAVAGLDDEEELEGIGLGLSAKGKKILKGVGIAAAAVVGIAAAPAILGAVGGAVKAIGGLATSVFGGLFGTKAPSVPVPPGPGAPPTAPTPPTAPPPTEITMDQILAAAAQIYALQRTNPAAAESMRMALIGQLVGAGLGQPQAADLVATALAQIAARREEPPTPVVPPIVLPGERPVERPEKTGIEAILPWAIGGAAVLLLATQLGRKKNPVHRQRHRR
jgi:hypothetical protein